MPDNTPTREERYKAALCIKSYISPDLPLTDHIAHWVETGDPQDFSFAEIRIAQEFANIRGKYEEKLELMEQCLYEESMGEDI